MMGTFIPITIVARNNVQSESIVNTNSVTYITRDDNGNATLHMRDGAMLMTKNNYNKVAARLNCSTEDAKHFGITPTIAQNHGIDYNDKEACEQLANKISFM